MIKYTMGCPPEVNYMPDNLIKWRQELQETGLIPKEEPLTMLPYVLNMKNRESLGHYLPEKWVAVSYGTEYGWQKVEVLDGPDIPNDYKEWIPHGVYFTEIEVDMELDIELTEESVTSRQLENLIRRAQAPVYPGNVGILVKVEEDVKLSSVIGKIDKFNGDNSVFLPLAKILYEIGITPVVSESVDRVGCKLSNKSCQKFLGLPYWDFYSMVKLLELVSKGVSIVDTLTIDESHTQEHIVDMRSLYQFAIQRNIPFNLDLFRVFLTVFSISHKDISRRTAEDSDQGELEKKIMQFKEGTIEDMMYSLMTVVLEDKILHFEPKGQGLARTPSLFPWIIPYHVDKLRVSLFGQEMQKRSKYNIFEYWLSNPRNQEAVLEYLEFVLGVFSRVTTEYIFSHIDLDLSSGAFVFKTEMTERAIHLETCDHKGRVNLITAVQNGLDKFIKYISRNSGFNIAEMLEISSTRSQIGDLYRERFCELLKCSPLTFDSTAERLTITTNYGASATSILDQIHGAGGRMSSKRLKEQLRHGGAFK